jgi:hypothetical protein
MTSIPPPNFGADAVSLRTAAGPAWVVKSFAAIPAPLREGAFARRGKDFRYQEVLESSLRSQFDFRYFVLHDETSGHWALQPMFFVDQDLLAGLPQGVRALFSGIRRLWPGFLKMRMMMIGCAAGEGELDHDEPWLAGALHEAVEFYRRGSGAFIILLKDVPSRYRPALEVFARHGYQRLPSMPGARLELTFSSFEEYMTQKLGKVFRKNLRRKLRASQDAAPIAMEVVTDATPCLDEIQALYRQTHERSDFSFEVLNQDYFRLLGERLPDRTRYFLWRQNGRLIAFSLCLLHDGVLDDLNVGMDYRVALDFSLYFYTWRDIIEWGLQNGVKVYQTGQLNYDPKAHLKLSLAPLDLYARHNWGIFNPIFKPAIKFFGPTAHNPVFKRFANYGDL